MDLFHLLFLFANYSILYTVSMSVNKLCWLYFGESHGEEECGCVIRVVYV